MCTNFRIHCSTCDHTCRKTKRAAWGQNTNTLPVKMLYWWLGLYQYIMHQCTQKLACNNIFGQIVALLLKVEVPKICPSWLGHIHTPLLLTPSNVMCFSPIADHSTLYEREFGEQAGIPHAATRHWRCCPWTTPSKQYNIGFSLICIDPNLANAPCLWDAPSFALSPLLEWSLSKSGIQ